MREAGHRDAKLYAGDLPASTVGISPVFGDTAGLPPLLIQVASDEDLLDDSRRVAKKARAAGVAVDLQVIDDVFHVFQTMTSFPESQQALAEIGRFYKRHI